jgi:hypothetical protein
MTDAIDSLEDGVVSGILCQDVSVLENLIHPDFTYTHTDGSVETRSELLRVISEGARSWASAKLQRMRRIDCGELATTLSRLNIELLYQGSAYQIEMVLAAAFSKRGTGQLVAWHGWHA